MREGGQIIQLRNVACNKCFKAFWGFTRYHPRIGLSDTKSKVWRAIHRGTARSLGSPSGTICSNVVLRGTSFPVKGEGVSVLVQANGGAL